MPLASVRVVAPLKQAVKAILDDYLAGVRADNRGDGTRPEPEYAKQPAAYPAFNVQYRRGRATPYAAETFATAAGSAVGLVREQHEYEITFDTALFDTEEAADAAEDVYSAFIDAGFDLGLTVDGDRPVKGWDANWRVDDIAGGRRPDDRGAPPGKTRKRIVFTLRVNLELQAAQRQPQEVP